MSDDFRNLIQEVLETQPGTSSYIVNTGNWFYRRKINGIGHIANVDEVACNGPVAPDFNVLLLKCPV